ncbi:DUF6881 domain-containing protein [Pseudoalteromonas ostreae]|uniref:DUF6881 domain-containing protein n=1 Tax=Pseudoalteromonas ostreae TaxID=2774154 RepID=UPI0039EE42C0
MHDLEDEPFRLVSEIGDDNFELRKLEASIICKNIKCLINREAQRSISSFFTARACLL